jgi:glutathione synthase/RimK-type ligase-like ATP-grasp enzyme
MTLLLAGGYEDPNLTALAAAAQRANVEVLDLRLPAGESRAFCWNPEEGAPRFSGQKIKATGAFIRHDVFGRMKDPRPEVTTRATGWYQTLMGWLLSEPDIRLFNRQISQVAMNKPAALVFAREVGLCIPQTWVTNEPGQFTGDQLGQMIAKPVLGGDYCYSLTEALDKTNLRGGMAATPAIVQKRLMAPEIRIYVIGKFSFAFEVRSNSLDYRVNQDAELVFLPEVPHEVFGLRKLMSRLEMDFGAADFKTDPDTGELVFLELNTGPMFGRFDQISGGQLCAAIIHELTAA